MNLAAFFTTWPLPQPVLLDFFQAALFRLRDVPGQKGNGHQQHVLRIYRPKVMQESPSSTWAEMLFKLSL